MFHKGVVLEETDFEGVKDFGPKAALVLNFKLYNCTYKHMGSVKHSQEPLWTLSLEFYDLLTTCLIFFAISSYILDRCPILSIWQKKKKPSCVAAKTQIMDIVKSE